MTRGCCDLESFLGGDRSPNGVGSKEKGGEEVEQQVWTSLSKSLSGKESRDG